MLPAIAQMLFSKGLTVLGEAVLAKGQDVIEQELGIKLDTASDSELRDKEIEHEEFLIEAALETKKLEIEAEKAAQANVTDRWKADMLSDSWLSKNVRPLVLVYLTAAVTLLAVLPINIEPAWIELLKAAYMLVLTAYFVGRTVEKHKDMHEKGKQS
jgi:hypothetical protein